MPLARAGKNCLRRGVMARPDSPLGISGGVELSHAVRDRSGAGSTSGGRDSHSIRGFV